jgi:uridine kinase
MGDLNGAVRRSTARADVRATLTDGRVFAAPLGTSLQQIIDAAFTAPDLPIVAAVANGRLRELTHTLAHDALLHPVTIRDDDGARIFRRSLIFLLVAAAEQEFPDAELIVQHAVPGYGGYYCEVRGRSPFSETELERLAARMRQIVAADQPIRLVRVSAPEATAAFTRRGEADKAALFAPGPDGLVPLYELSGRLDYFHGLMASSAGCLQPFAVRGHPRGFVLQFPHQADPTALQDVTPYPKLFEIFGSANYLLEKLGIRSAGALNDAIRAGRLPEVSLVAEAMHEAGVAKVASDIASHPRGPIKLVLVAGPSASGKTTFSKRLAIQLLARGLKPFAFALDDYFLDRDLTPRDASGQHDFESLAAIDTTLFNHHLQRLVGCEPVQLPRYSFLTGRRELHETMVLGQESIIIIEGIHGLNPALIPDIPTDTVYRVYVSALTQLNLDRHNRISTSDSRLIRRVVRDAATRGYSATDSLRRWLSVARGEKQYIFPFQEHSDAIFNSSLVHELAVLRPFAEPLLLQVQPKCPEYEEAGRLLALLRCFRPAPASDVPDNSILREFVGGSILEGFKVWSGDSNQG